MQKFLLAFLISQVSVYGITVANGEWQYSLATGSATVTGYTGSGGIVTIPDQLGGYPVTTIGHYAFKNRTNINQIIIPNNVEQILNYAFEGCSNLNAVSFNNNLKIIGNYAFKDCVNLSSITIPDSVTTIQFGVFQGCSKLSDVTLGSGVLHIPISAFGNCSSLSSIIIPSSVLSIGPYAFLRCTNLTYVQIGNSVLDVGVEAFGECSKLNEVVFLGNAPTSGGNWSNCPATVFVSPGATGWGNSFGGRPVVFIGTQLPPVTSGGTASGIVDTAFSYHINALRDPTSFGASGLPAGLQINITSGEISGTPSVAGNYTVSIYSSNSGGTSSAILTISISKITPQILSLPNSSPIDEGQSLAYSILTGGVANVLGHFSWSFPSIVPSVGVSSHGITFNPVDGSKYNPTTASLNVIVNSVSQGDISITSDLSSVSLNLGVGYSYQISATGSPTSYGAVGLPNGLRLNGKTGLVSGFATKTGTFSVTLVAKRAGAPPAAATKVITVVQAPGFAYPATFNLNRGRNVNFRPRITGFPAPTFSVTAGSLPPGLSLNASTAAITGIPTAAGSYAFTVRGTNSAGQTSRSTTILVK